MGGVQDPREVLQFIHFDGQSISPLIDNLSILSPIKPRLSLIFLANVAFFLTWSLRCVSPALSAWGRRRGKGDSDPIPPHVHRS